MSEEETKLTRNLSFIKDNITDLDSILDKLIEENIVRLEERSRIFSIRNPRHQIQAVLETVIKKRAYDTFIKALKDSGNHHIIERLKSTDSCTDSKQFKVFAKKTYLCKNNKLATNDENKESEYTEKLKKDLQNLQSENSHLREQQQCVRLELDTKQKKMEELSKEVDVAKSQNEKLKARLALLHDSDKLNEKLRNIEKELVEKDKENEELDTAIVKKEEEMKELQKECKKLRHQLEEKTHQISILNEETRALREELEIARKERQALSGRLDDMSSNIDRNWTIMMDALEKRLNPKPQITDKHISDRMETSLPLLKTNSSHPLKFMDNRYSLTPRDKMKARQQHTTTTPRQTPGSKKTAFISTKPRTFNKFLK